MRFQDAAPDARASSTPGSRPIRSVARAAALLADATYEQRLLARAVMNGETTDAAAWRTMFPSLFDPAVDPDDRDRSEAILAASLEVADRGEQVRSQFRGAIVESLTALLLDAAGRRRVGRGASAACCSTGSGRRSIRTT